MVRRHFRFRRLLLGLAFAAIVVPVAQGQPGDAGFWTERPVGSQVSAHGGSTPAISQAEARQWRARIDSYAAPSGNTAAQRGGTNEPDGFNWTDAGIGAAVTFGAAAFLLAVVAVGRRHRLPRDRVRLAST